VLNSPSPLLMSEWSQLECEAIIQDYMAMFGSELKGEPYSKAEHRRALLPKLDSRTEGSIEFKHQNISAVLIELGYPYITGYKPAWNYQKLLKDIIVSYLSANKQVVEQSVNDLIAIEPAQPDIDNWQQVLTDPPESTKESNQHRVREYRPGYFDFSAREAGNRKLGLTGEEFIMKYEDYRLRNLGREDLAKEIEWTSKVKGDGAGYDIRSFDVQNEKELFIEVKTTNSGKYQPFYISDNEVSFSDQYASQYALYRVYQMKADPKLFKLFGQIESQVNLSPKTYSASFR